jgi:hypothetical protein
LAAVQVGVAPVIHTVTRKLSVSLCVLRAPPVHDRDSRQVPYPLPSVNGVMVRC